jgi:hypothetical protein
VINPQYRELDSEVKKQAACLARKRCEWNAIVLCDDIELAVVTAYETKKAALQEEIEHRAESAMTNIVRQSMCRRDDARSLLRSLYTTEADIIPDQAGEKLTIRIHQPANRCSAESVLHLIGELNATRTVFPGTDLRLVYELVT